VTDTNKNVREKKKNNATSALAWGVSRGGHGKECKEPSRRKHEVPLRGVRKCIRHGNDEDEKAKIQSREVQPKSEGGVFKINFG